MRDNTLVGVDVTVTYLYNSNQSNQMKIICLKNADKQYYLHVK